MLQFLICSPSRCGSFSSSSSQTPSAGMIVQAAFFSACFFCTLSPHAAGIIFACLICSSGRCGSFFGVHQQWKTSTREQFLHVLQVRTKTRKMTWRMHDMRYSCFQPS
ncbi:hypothetical protein ACFX15_039760 [Malus domestica]